MLSQDVVRRLTVIATDTGLTTLKTKLDAVDNAQDRVAMSSTRMGRATEQMERQIRAITAQATATGTGLLGGFAGRAGAEALAMVGRFGPAALTAYAGFKLLNATVERGTELLEKYGLAGQRALYGGAGVEEGIAKLTQFQGDTATLQQQKYAAELSGRLDEANRQIKEFLKVQIDLTNPALKLMNAWVVIEEKIASAAGLASKIPEPALSVGGSAVLDALIPGFGVARNAVNYLADKPPGEPTADEAMRIARGRLGAGLAAGGMIGKNASAGFYGRFNAITDSPPKPEKATAAAEADFDRLEKSMQRQAAAMEAESRAVGMSAGAHAALRAEMRLQETALQDIAKNGGAMEDYEDRIKKIADRIGEATQKAAELRLNSDLGFERAQLGRDPIEAGVAARLRPIYGDDYVNQMNGSTAATIRFNEQLRETRDLATDFAVGGLGELRNQLREGVPAWQAFGNAAVNAVTRLTDKLADQALTNGIARLVGSGGFQSLFSFGGGSGIVPGTEALPGLQFHSGGIVGAGGSRLYVHPAYYENANRFASGGVAGLGPDEVSAILHRNEEVLTRDDPRHRWNGGGMGGATPVLVNVNVDNSTDSTVDVQQKQNSSGGVDLEIMVHRVVKKGISTGEYDNSNRSRYNLAPGGRRN